MFAVTPQLVAAVRGLILIVGTLLASWGLLTKEQLATLTDVGTITGVLAAVATVASFVWVLWSNRSKAIIAKAAKLPQVDAVIADPAVARAVPARNVVATVTEAQRVMGVGQG